jgi:hypothetical protein
MGILVKINDVEDRYATCVRYDKDKKEWVCIYCGQRVQKKYIATSHDHTDYSYDVCSCPGARKNGVHEDNLN